MTQEGSYAAIILAAGRSSRFAGGHKLAATIAGQPLVRRTLQAVSASPVDDIVLVLAPESEGEILAAAGEGRWRPVVNPIAREGLSASIRAGLSSLTGGTCGALIVLADMPGLSPRLIARLIEAANEHPGSIVYPLTPERQQGHPVLWPADIFAEFADLTGDQGGKPLLKRHAHRIVTIEAGAEAGFDIDTVEDLAAFTRGRGSQ